MERSDRLPTGDPARYEVVDAFRRAEIHSRKREILSSRAFVPGTVTLTTTGTSTTMPKVLVGSGGHGGHAGDASGCDGANIGPVV